MTDQALPSSQPGLPSNQHSLPSNGHSLPILPSAQRAFLPHDRMELTSGYVALSGIDALLRILVDQRLADITKGLSTAGVISGYRGSPLAGVDSQYFRYKNLFEERDIVFVNGVNEELAANVVWGSQLSSAMQGALFDGVMGMWYGKAPGVDRAGDAMRHANMSGTSPHGGVLCVAGDDPACKSSTLPSATEGVLSEISIPVLFPGSVQEVLDMGRWGFELSRACGLWVGFKLVTDIADAYATVQVGPKRVQPVPLELAARNGEVGASVTNLETIRWRQQLLPPWVLEIEQELKENRMAAALEFVKQNNLTTFEGADNENAPWLGILSAGKSYYDVCEVLEHLQIADLLPKLGIRLMKPAMVWPLEPTEVQAFASGLKTILVVEEKGPFIESQLRNILYPLASRPEIMGKSTPSGEVLFPNYGFIEADTVERVLHKVFADHADILQNRVGLENSQRLIQTPAESAMDSSDLPRRSAYYCSGCPHNRSNVTPEGSITLGGIGCHSMSLFIPSRQVQGLTQMGGEGATWVGAAPFVSDSHRFQNLGDGTLFHSGSLAIRQAVDAGVNITYKILYNSVVAMTGGQAAAGEMSVADLTMLLAAEGVRRTVVVTDDKEKYPSNTVWAANVELRNRDEVVEVQKELREIPGTTALIYDQECAADLRKQRRRGNVEAPGFRLVINERVCEGCGDCAKVSNCLSVFPVETEFGQKTRIHQESCNQDFTCMEGNCPSFVKIIEKRPRKATQRKLGRERSTGSKGKKLRTRGDQHMRTKGASTTAAEQIFGETLAQELPEPASRPAESNLLLAGIGGTGVVTASQILGTAALLENKFSLGLDQTGLSQKGGQVVSNLKISTQPQQVSNRIGPGQADALLLFDLLAISDDAVVRRLSQERTAAAVSTSELPTGEMIANDDVRFPESEKLHERLAGRTRETQNVWVDAERLSKLLFKSQPPANIIVVGAAYQGGLLPVSADSVEKAIEINGVAADTNLAAFRLGRAVVADETLQERLLSATQASREQTSQDRVSSSAEAEQLSKRQAKRQAKHQLIEKQVADIASPGSELHTELLLRAQDLVSYQSQAYARQYLQVVAIIHQKAVQTEAQAGNPEAVTTEAVTPKTVTPEAVHSDVDTPGVSRLTLAVVRNLYKLMAYKDEYEVARLHLLEELRTQIRNDFSPKARIAFLLQPPLLTKLGLTRKITIPMWLAKPSFYTLRSMRKVRGTFLDVFSYTRERRMESKLVLEYIDMINELASQLTPQNYDQIAEVAELADMIRGYDTVKLETVDQYHTELTRKLSELLAMQGEMIESAVLLGKAPRGDN